MQRSIERWLAGWRRWRRTAPAVWRRIAGWPDYAAYLEHCRHAGHPPRLSESEFLEDFFRARAGTSRCC